MSKNLVQLMKGGLLFALCNGVGGDYFILLKLLKKISIHLKHISYITSSNDKNDPDQKSANAITQATTVFFDCLNLAFIFFSLVIFN